MSRWLKNVNALLDNLDNQVEETVEEHRFNRTLTAAARKADGGEREGGDGGVAELLKEEAQGVDDILAKRGLLVEEEDEGHCIRDGEYKSDADNPDAVKENTEAEGGDAADADVQAHNRVEELEPRRVGFANDKGGEDTLEEVVSFRTDSSLNEGDANVHGDAPLAKNKDTPTKAQVIEVVTTSPKPTPASETSAGDKIPAKSTLQEETPSSKISAPSKISNTSNCATAAAVAEGAASLKELRKLRRHVLQLNSDLESAEREIEAQRAELDRAASRMDRDRSRHKQERESAEASRKAEVAALVAAHERSIQKLKESNESAVAEMEERVSRMERRRVEEGGERDAELATALERERACLASAAKLQEEKVTMNERIVALTTATSRLETRLEHATSQMELASERERNAEEQLDEALSLHARQLGVRQKRESELEQTVAELGAALVVAKGKVETKMKAGINTDCELIPYPASGEVPEGTLDLRAHLQDSQDEVETLRAQLGLERQRCSTLHDELRDLSREQAEEMANVHAKQRQYERKISDLTTAMARLQSSGGRMVVKEDNTSTDYGAVVEEDYAGLQHSGDEEKETDHLRKQIASLSEKVFQQQARIDAGRGEISTLKNRLRSMTVRAETAEKNFDSAQQQLIIMDAPVSGMSSADEETGLVRGRASAKKRRPTNSSNNTSRGFRKAPKVGSIRSALGLHPGRHPTGGWYDTLASLLDVFDALAVDMGSHLRHHPLSRLAFMVYLVMLHAWAFFLLVYHAHAQGTGGSDHYGPEALLRSYPHMELTPKVVQSAAATPVPKVLEAAGKASP